MRIANLEGRLVLVVPTDEPTGCVAVDVEAAGRGVFDADPQAVYERWDEFRAFVADLDLDEQPRIRFDPTQLGPAVPAPRQILAIGLNYRAHAAESGLGVPDDPLVFTKFVSCLTGPRAQVELPPDGHVDWEIELVAVIGRRAHRVAAADAWAHVAGLTVGQDVSERITQTTGAPPQFSLGKSFPGFGPIGPWVVSVDEFADPDDLAVECSINGEQVQSSRTGDLIFGVPELVARLSAVLPLEPGDVIFTGTPSGVGMGRTPPRWLADGDLLVSSIEGIGELSNRFVEG